MPAARAASSRLIPSSALASASRRALTRPSRSRRATARSSAGVRPVVIGTATMARLPARYSRAKSWAAVTTGQDFLRPVSDLALACRALQGQPLPSQLPALVVTASRAAEAVGPVLLEQPAGAPRVI